MTKETKIGLLVGLAFIILFAIILSEQGATPGRTAPSTFSLADSSSGGDRVLDAEKPLATDGRLPVERALEPEPANAANVTARTGEGPSTPEGPTGRPIPTEDDPLPPIPASVVARLNQPVEGPAVEETPAGAEKTAKDSAAAEPSVSLEEAMATALATEIVPPAKGQRSAADATPKASMVSHLADAQAGRNPAGPSNDGAEKVESDRSVAVKAVHVVALGESLSKIAAKHYGRATPIRIQAIFDANRDVLRSVDRVKANDELKIPDLGSAAAGFEPAPDFTATDVVSAQPSRREGPVRIPVPVGAAPSAGKDPSKHNEPASNTRIAAAEEPRTPKVRWYEVRQRDTLSKIAKRELGNEKRFLEIYRMNRDLIKNRDLIRPGLRLRLPAAGSSATTPTAVASTGGTEGGEP